MPFVNALHIDYLAERNLGFHCLKICTVIVSDKIQCFQLCLALKHDLVCDYLAVIHDRCGITAYNGFHCAVNAGYAYIFTDNELLSCGELSCTADFVFSCLYVTAFNIRYYFKRCYVLDLYPEADRSPDINASARNRTAGSIIHLRLDSNRAVVG